MLDKFKFPVVFHVANPCHRSAHNWLSPFICCPQVPLCLRHIIPVHLHLDPSPSFCIQIPFLPCEHRVEQAAMFLHNYGLGMAVLSTVLFDLSIIIPSVLVFGRSNCFHFSGSVRENRLHAFLLHLIPNLVVATCCKNTCISMFVASVWWVIFTPTQRINIKWSFWNFQNSFIYDHFYDATLNFCIWSQYLNLAFQIFAHLLHSNFPHSLLLVFCIFLLSPIPVIFYLSVVLLRHSSAKRLPCSGQKEAVRGTFRLREVAVGLYRIQ